MPKLTAIDMPRFISRCLGGSRPSRAALQEQMYLKHADESHETRATTQTRAASLLHHPGGSMPSPSLQSRGEHRDLAHEAESASVAPVLPSFQQFLVDLEAPLLHSDSGRADSALEAKAYI